MLARRFGLIEERLRTLYEHLGIPYAASEGDDQSSSGESGAASTSSDLPAEVVDLAQAGHRTDAISRLRHLTGMTLLEATRAVDALGR